MHQDTSLVVRLRALITKGSVLEASRLLGISRECVARILAELPVREGTKLVVERALERLEAGK